jgi:vancomycin resistance protein YoaR
MFNTTLIANLQIVERHQHSQRVSYVPLGRDAAIYWGSYDYQFKNTTGYPLKIVMKCDNGQLTCSFYTCQDISPKAVDLKVTQNGNHFTLKRYVDGKVNYTTSSTY